MTGQILLDRQRDGITIIMLDRPQARNAMTVDMARQLTAVLDEVEADATCHVVVLAAQGSGFCAGLDLKHSLNAPDAPRGAADWMALQEVFSSLMRRVARLRQPVVAAVQGAAVGAGLGLALASDIRIGTPTTTLLVGAVKMGLSAGECGISYHLPRLIGAGRAQEIMLTGRPVGSEEALAIGLLTNIVEPDVLLDRALHTARLIAQNAPYSIKHSRQVMHANQDAPSLDSALELENHVQVVALMTDDFREAATAFAEKRPPLFTGR